MENRVKIISSDNRILSVDKAVLEKMSGLKILLENQENNELEINFQIELLEIVFSFYENHKHEQEIEIKAPLDKSINFQKLIDKKDSKMLEQLNLTSLQQLISLCDFLQYYHLLNISCAYLANKIQYMDTSIIRQLFNIQQDQTKKQLERIQFENEWLEE